MTASSIIARSRFPFNQPQHLLLRSQQPNMDALTLPPDLLHLLSQQLADDGDFSTLYSCVASSRSFANSGAVLALYRLIPPQPAYLV